MHVCIMYVVCLYLCMYVCRSLILNPNPVSLIPSVCLCPSISEMGLFGRWRSSKKTAEESPATQDSQPYPNPNSPASAPNAQAETSVFEFGSCTRYGDGGGVKGAAKVEGEDAGKTLAGFCPVSEHLEPCRWELLPSSSDNAPLFRILF